MQTHITANSEGPISLISSNYDFTSSSNIFWELQNAKNLQTYCNGVAPDKIFFLPKVKILFLFSIKGTH